MGSDQRRDAPVSAIEAPQYDAGMMDIPTPTTAAQAPTILIVSEDELQTAKSASGFETNTRVFAETDVVRALPCISRERPGAVVLGRAFVSSSRDECPQPQAFIQLAHQNETGVGGDPRSLERDLQKAVERELKRLVL